METQVTPSDLRELFNAIPLDLQPHVIGIMKHLAGAPPGETRPENPLAPEALADALAWLTECERSTADMTADQCARALAAYDYDVYLALTSPRGVDLCPGEPGYWAVRNWTVKGLRWELARERFLERFTMIRDEMEGADDVEG